MVEMIFTYLRGSVKVHNRMTLQGRQLFACMEYEPMLYPMQVPMW